MGGKLETFAGLSGIGDLLLPVTVSIPVIGMPVI